MCDEVAQPLSVCQSFCLHGGPSMPPATQVRPPSHRRRGSASGKLSAPPPSFTGFYLNFTSCPFSVYYFLTSSSGPRRAGWGERGSMLRGVEFFYRSWHPWRSVTRHFALSASLFFPSPALLWKAPPGFTLLHFLLSVVWLVFLLPHQLLLGALQLQSQSGGLTG